MKKNNRHILAGLLLALSSVAYAQESVTDTVASRQDEPLLPESMIISEEEMMKDFANATNLSRGEGTAPSLSYDDSVLVHRLSRIPTTIEMPLNNVTREYIQRYAEKMKGSVAVMLGASNFYTPIFEEALERYGLPLELKYLPIVESALRPQAVSRAGAAGLWQFMITTGKRYGLEVTTLVDDRCDPVKSSDAAARYLRDLYGMFGDWGLALAAYNCGENGIQKTILRSGEDKGDFWTLYDRLPRETRGYVPAFIAATYIMNYYCEHGIVPYDATLPAETDTVVVKTEVSFAQVASKCNVTVDGLRALNPQYRRDIVPAQYTLRIPQGEVENFIMNEDSIYGLDPSKGYIASGLRKSVTEDVGVEQAQKSSRASNKSQRTQARYVTVRSGDTLSAIAKRNGTTVTKIKRLNGMKTDFIKQGQSLRVK